MNRKTLLTAVWLATTPLALMALTAQPVGAQDLGHENVAEVAPSEHDQSDAHGGAHHPVLENLISFSYKKEHKPPPFAMAVVNFLLFAFVLSKIMGPALTRRARERHEVLARSLAEGARLRDEAQRKLDEYSQRLAALDDEIAGILQGIRDEAEAEKRRIVTDAEARAVRIEKEAQQQIDVEIQKVRGTLEREAVAAAVEVAERILREKTTDSDHKKMADRFVATLKAPAKA